MDCPSLAAQRCPYLVSGRAPVRCDFQIGKWRGFGSVRAACSCSPAKLSKELADQKEIPAVQYSRTQAQRCFAQFGATTKLEIAVVIAEHIPAFERYVPPVRKPWMSEEARMGLFDAAALALTFFQSGLPKD